MDLMLKYGLILIVVSLSACSIQITNPITDEHRARAEQTFNATTLTASLEQILLWHQTNQTEIVPALNPSIDKAAIQGKFVTIQAKSLVENIHIILH